MDEPTAMQEDNKDNDLIFVSMENWDDIWRRNQLAGAAL
jgi:hypothetical protein